jgi:hypothetical protein
MMYIYCNYKERSRQSVFNLVTSLLKQLVQDHTVAYESVKTLHLHHKNQETRPTLEQILEAFRLATGTFSKVFVVVDALDECSDTTRAELLTALRSLANPINLLVTSRDLASIAQEFRGTKHLDIRANDQDVRRYIEGRIPCAPFLKIHVDKDATLQEEILKAITENVDGMLVSYALVLI